MSKKEIKQTEKEISKEKEEVLTTDTRIKALLRSRKRIIQQKQKQIEALITNAPYAFMVWLIGRFKKVVNKI